MATAQAPEAGSRTSEAAQAAQAGLAVVVASQVRQFVDAVVPGDAEQSSRRLQVLLAAVVKKYGPASAALASQFYQRQRLEAGVPGRLYVRPASLPPQEQVAKTVDWVTQPLAATPASDAVVGERLTGAAEKLVLDVGRSTVIDTAKSDPKARGWARVPEPGACYFCALLATRGAVYKKETVGFRSHDHCRCHAEPVFNAYEPSAQVRQWQADYAQATAGVRGSKNLQRAWRNAFEGRTTP